MIGLLLYWPYLRRVILACILMTLVIGVKLTLHALQLFLLLIIYAFCLFLYDVCQLELFWRSKYLAFRKLY